MDNAERSLLKMHVELAEYELMNDFTDSTQSQTLNSLDDIILTDLF
jgi:hypothetical protein